MHTAVSLVTDRGTECWRWELMGWQTLVLDNSERRRRDLN